MPMLHDDVHWPARTDRLVLRPATADDLHETWRFRRLDIVSRWLTHAPQALDEHLEQMATPESLAKTLVIEHDEAVIGDLMVAIGDAWSQAEADGSAAAGVQADLGWSLHPDAGGRGLATEAVREVLRICFADLGLRREAHTVADALHRSGDWLDSYAYALLADEWRARL